MDLIKIQNALKQASDQQLQAAARSPQAEAPPFMVMLEMKRRSEMRNGRPPEKVPNTSLAEEMPRRLEESGLNQLMQQAQQTQSLAARNMGQTYGGGGPVVAFADGGLTSPYPVGSFMDRQWRIQNPPGPGRVSGAPWAQYSPRLQSPQIAPSVTGAPPEQPAPMDFWEQYNIPRAFRSATVPQAPAGRDPDEAMRSMQRRMFGQPSTVVPQPQEGQPRATTMGPAPVDAARAPQSPEAPPDMAGPPWGYTSDWERFGTPDIRPGSSGTPAPGASPAPAGPTVAGPAAGPGAPGGGYRISAKIPGAGGPAPDPEAEYQKFLKAVTANKTNADPYADLKKQIEDLSGDPKKTKYDAASEALLMAGLATLASKSGSALGAIGEGGMVGLRNYTQAMKEAKESQYKTLSANATLAQIKQMENQGDAQKAMAMMTYGQHERLAEKQMATTLQAAAISKSGHDPLALFHAWQSDPKSVEGFIKATKPYDENANIRMQQMIETGWNNLIKNDPTYATLPPWQQKMKKDQYTADIYKRFGLTPPTGGLGLER